MNRKNVRMSKYVTGEGEAEARKGYTSHKANTFVFKDKSGQRKKKKKNQKPKPTSNNTTKQNPSQRKKVFHTTQYQKVKGTH